MDKILVIEDDIALNNGLKMALNNEGYTVIQYFDYTMINNQNYCLAIIDIDLPSGNGFELSKNISCPKLFLTAKTDESSILKGYEYGCEEYVTKPFSIKVLMEKIKVILKRQNDQDTYYFKNLSYNYDHKEMKINDRSIGLSKKEHDVVAFLIKHKEKVISKKQLLESCWDIYGDYVNESTVSVTINRIRRKMNTPGQWIQTVFGIGYKWSETHERS